MTDKEYDWITDIVKTALMYYHKAEEKHPDWGNMTMSRAALTLLEEAGEVAKAYNDWAEYVDSVPDAALEGPEHEKYQRQFVEEVLDTVVVGMRILVWLRQLREERDNDR